MLNWRDIMDRHGPSVWRTAYRLVRNEEDAADCLQEAFLDALEISRREEVKNWRGLLVRLGTTRALDRLRRNLARSRRSDPGAEVSRLEDRSPAPPEALSREDLAPRLRRALAALPGRQAEIFCLRFLEEESYEEIAALTGIGVDNVGVQIHRARQRLREMLGARPQEQEGGSRNV